MQVPRPRDSNLLRLLPDLRYANQPRKNRMRLLSDLLKKRPTPGNRPANIPHLRDQCPCPAANAPNYTTLQRPHQMEGIFKTRKKKVTQLAEGCVMIFSFSRLSLAPKEIITQPYFHLHKDPRAWETPTRTCRGRAGLTASTEVTMMKMPRSKKMIRKKMPWSKMARTKMPCSKMLRTKKLKNVPRLQLAIQ